MEGDLIKWLVIGKLSLTELVLYYFMGYCKQGCIQAFDGGGAVYPKGLVCMENTKLFHRGGLVVVPLCKGLLISTPILDIIMGTTYYAKC